MATPKVRRTRTGNQSRLFFFPDKGHSIRSSTLGGVLQQGSNRIGCSTSRFLSEAYASITCIKQKTYRYLTQVYRYAKITF